MGGGGVGDWVGVSVWGGRESILEKKSLLTRLLKIKKKCSKKGTGGQFHKRNPLKRNFWKPQNFAKKFLTEDPILSYTFFKKSRSP